MRVVEAPHPLSSTPHDGTPRAPAVSAYLLRRVARSTQLVNLVAALFELCGTKARVAQIGDCITALSQFRDGRADEYHLFDCVQRSSKVGDREDLHQQHVRTEGVSSRVGAIISSEGASSQGVGRGRGVGG